MNMVRRSGISFAIAALVLAGFLFWYDGPNRLLSPAEVESYLARIAAQSHSPGGRHDMAALRRLLEEDDGQPVYTVNLYQFHDIADYPEGSGFSGSGREAYERFSQVMVRLMLARGSHPVFGSSWADTANTADSADTHDNGWDRIVVVRYRSRRDLVDLFATDAFAEASLHKWASIKAHDRMVVKARHIPGGEVIGLLLALVLGTISFALMQIFGSRLGMQHRNLKG